MRLPCLKSQRSSFWFHAGNLKQILFITGTDTGVGKTVLTALLVRLLRADGVNAAALKSICSGGRGDACALHEAMNGVLSLHEINPWHFRAPLAPLLAARRERKHVHLPHVLAHLRAMQQRFEVLIVEGAGGLMSPLGEDFDSGDLIAALGAAPVVMAPNRLGAVNHVLLTLDALPRGAGATAQVVFMESQKPDAAAKMNVSLLAEFLKGKRILTLPWLENIQADTVLRKAPVRRALRALAR